MGSIAHRPRKIDRYVVDRMESREEMDRIIDVIWAANYTPYDPIAQIVFPVLGFTEADRATSLAESKARFWKQHLSDPSSNWFYVSDASTGAAVGCCQWQIFTSNPFPHGAPKMLAPWWPEGEHRDFCESILTQIYKPRASWMRRPHLALNWMAVIPSHRRLGIGSLLMKVGTSRADDLSLPCWMESSAMGRPLYERSGFRSLLKIALDTEKEEASNVWRKCEYEMTPAPLFIMWRPKGGAWEAQGREVTMPWHLAAG